MNLRARLSTLIAVRVVIVTVLLGSATLVELSRPGTFPVDPFFWLIGLTYALSVGYLATLRFAGRHPWLADLQFAMDALVVSAFIHLTGGITSNFSSLYLLPIVSAAMIRYRRVATQVAVLSAGLYLALVVAQYVDYALPPAALAPPRELPTLRLAQYTVAINLGGFFAVALLAGSLAESLRSAGARLEVASHAIRDLRAFNEHIIDSLMSGLITTDDQCRVLTLNRAAAAITGIGREQALGRDALEVLRAPEDVRGNLADLEASRGLRVEIQYPEPDGSAVEIGVTINLLAFPDGARGYLFAFQDVTTIRRLEREGRQRQRLAAVGEMAAGIAHEIRNPLASMSGSIQVLRQELPLSEDQAELMDIVLRESERLNDTIRSFLAYARPQRLSTTRFDVGRVVQEAARLLRNGAEVRDTHRIEVEAPSGPVWCEGDENQIRQVVWNLASNGVRAMADGGRLRLAVASATAPAGARSVVLTIEDEGCGIPPEALDGIFQPFRSTFEKGTGLGLATVHRIVTDYTGCVVVSSGVGAGTRFTVRLPAEGGVPQAGAPDAPVLARAAV
jgi:two-component system sensor histidine kinase PilS (NtrC family)